MFHGSTGDLAGRYERRGNSRSIDRSFVNSGKRPRIKDVDRSSFTNEYTLPLSLVEHRFLRLRNELDIFPLASGLLPILPMILILCNVLLIARNASAVSMGKWCFTGLRMQRVEAAEFSLPRSHVVLGIVFGLNRVEAFFLLNYPCDLLDQHCSVQRSNADERQF